KHRLLAHIRDLQTRQAALRSDLAGLEDAIARLEADALQRHLQTIPVEKLADFPNIGPVTITRLQDAGCRRVGDAVNANFGGIPCIGPQRANDLRAAVKSLVKEARSRFDAGAC